MHFKSPIICSFCCCFPCFSSQRKKSQGKEDNKSEASVGNENGSKGPTNKIAAQALTFRELTNATKNFICCCFPCFSSQRKKSQGTEDIKSEASSKSEHVHEGPTNNIATQAFTFRELATATKNFRKDCQLGEGGFGRVYKGKLAKSGQIVAVKQLDRRGLQGNKEFLVEVLMLSQIAHSNLVNLVGYCSDGDQRLLVYEYMSSGSLEDHMFDLRPNQKPLDWYTRMKIALGAAKGLHYLHEKAKPPIIYRDLKSSNILLDEHFFPKLSDFGLAKLGPLGGNMHVSTRVMGTYGYCAPEYQRTGHLTVKSDVYSFGVVFLELITGRRAIDTRRPNDEQNLVNWAQPFLNDPKQFMGLADPALRGQVPSKGLNQAAAIAAMCLQDEEVARPMMSDVVIALSFLAVPPEELNISLMTSLEPSPSVGDQPAAIVSGSNKVHPDEDTDLALERQRALAEAMEWGQTNANSRVGSSYST